MSSPSPPPPPVGVPFGRYVIRTRLGRGGMGEVFLADQLGPLGPVRPVALKRLLPRHTDDPQVVRLFLEEMGTAAQLSHPDIAVTYDFGEVDGVYFLAMEYVDGLPLDQLLSAKGRLPPDPVVAVGLAVCRALAHAHGRRAAGAPAPVVHQDVSPHNVIVARDGAAKLLDFGIARTEAAARQGSLRAKVRYAAPEQLRGAAPDRRFDVWGLGVTLYQALTGRLPFPQAELAERLRASERGAYPAVAEVCPEAAHLSGVVARALAPDPQDRFQSADEMRAALVAAHPLEGEAARACLAELVSDVSVAPAHLDGGEPTSTGVAAYGSVTPAGSDAAPSPPAEPDAPAPTFRDDGPTRVTRRRAAPLSPPDRAPPRPRAWPIVAAGLTLGAALVVALRMVSSPSGEAPSLDAGGARIAARGARDVEARRAASNAAGVDAASEPAQPEAVEEAAAAPRAEAPTPPPDAPRAPKREASRRRRPRAPSEEPRAPEPATRARPTQKRPPAQPSAKSPGSSESTDLTPPRAGLGLLSVRTVPWSRVSVDGRPLGEGVIARRPLEAGAHDLRLDAGEGGHAPKELRIEIRRGETTRVFFDFARGELRVTPQP